MGENDRRMKVMEHDNLSDLQMESSSLEPKIWPTISNVIIKNNC